MYDPGAILCSFTIPYGINKLIRRVTTGGRKSRSLSRAVFAGVRSRRSVAGMRPWVTPCHHASPAARPRHGPSAVTAAAATAHPGCCGTPLR